MATNGPDGSPQGSVHGSPQQSPGASPTAMGAMDGAEVAQRLVMAAEAASVAARAAVEVAQQVRQAQATSSSNSTNIETDEKAWYKLLPKPSNFDPKNREEEISQWRDWSWSFKQYLASLDPKFVGEIKTIRENVTTEIDPSVQTDPELKRSSFLYGLLASLVRQRPLLVVKQTADSNGFEAFRKLIESCEPMNKNRAMSLLSIIMNWPQFNPKLSLLSQVLKLETAYGEYEKLGNKLADEIKAAVLLRCVTGQVKTWLQLQVNDKTTFLQLRELVLTYDQQTTKWSENMVLGSMMDDPMDGSGGNVNLVNKGKEKGKGKRKGKNQGKQGKEKGKSQSWDNSWKGKGYGHQNESKGKGKSEKGKGKSKKDVSQLSCHSCGKKGHLARDCWSREKVRQVEKTGDTQPSAQSDTSPTQSQNQNKTVRRVEDPITLTFDLCDNSDSLGHVRAVRCERFFVGDEDSDVECETCERIPEVHLLEDSSMGATMPSSSSMWSLDDYEVDYEKVRYGLRLGAEPWSPKVQQEPKRRKVSDDLQLGDLHVRVVSEGVGIILDSGSDATILPYEYINFGSDTSNLNKLWDAQGQQIHTQGCKEVQIGLQGEGGEQILLKDKGHISKHVTQPLISYGRLLRKGWGVGYEDGEPKLVHGRAGVKVAIEFQNDSLLVRGSIRRVQHVRHVPVTVPEAWNNLGRLWSVTPKGFPICCSYKSTFVDPREYFTLDEWPFRTALCFNGASWEMIEFCEDMRNKENKEEKLDPKFKKIITILTLEAVAPEQMGFASEGLGATDAAMPQRAEGHPVQPEGAQGAEVGGEVAQQPEPPQRMELVVGRDVVEVAGVKVYPNSSVKTLQAACEYFSISQGGSKQKLWNRILAHLDKMNIQAAQEIVVQAKREGERVPQEQKLNLPPDDYNEVLKHNLTHLPYANWCPSCIKGKGRPDYRKEDFEKYTKRQLPCISFDLFYTTRKVRDPLV